MKKSAMSIVAGLLSLGFVAGCGTATPVATNAKNSTASRLTVTSTDSNTTGAKNTANATTNSTGSVQSEGNEVNSQSTNHVTSPSSSAILTKTSLTVSNFDVASLVAPSKMIVDNVSFNPAPAINGILEPVVLTVNFTKVAQPLHMDMNGFILNNPSANIGGGIAYYQYNNVIYKTSANYPGNFPVESALTISKDSTIVFVCTVGTPVPPAKVDLVYKNKSFGSYSATATSSYTLN